MSPARLATVFSSGVVALFVVALSSPAAAQQLPDPAATPEPPPTLTIERDESQLKMFGDSSSAAHESILIEIAESFSPDLKLTNELRLRAPLPAGWSLVTEMVLRAVGVTRSSTAEVNEETVSIRGVTLDQAAWQIAAERVQKSLLTGMQLRLDVVPLQVGVSFEQQCHELLLAVSSQRPIEFSQSSNTLNFNSYSLLDALVEVAADCPAVSIGVTGHSDGSGDEQANIELSRMRAESVAAYMVAHGIPADRLKSSGAGSAMPLVTENSPRARARNRRIEFEFSFARRESNRGQ